jgi:hypothetical protein
MAASHVTGLAALVLAHHPDFRGPFKSRNADRVDRLFQILRASAQPIHVGDARRTGFGMPDVLVALGLAPQLRPNLFANHALFSSALPFAFYPELGQFSGMAFGHNPGPAPIGIW